VFWESDDAFTVFFEGSNVAKQEFTVSSLEEDGRKATLEGQVDAEADTYLAIYPHSETNAYADGEITVNIPSVQTVVANSFASGANVAVAYSTDGNLKFRNVGSLIAFRFETPEDAARTESVTFRAKKADGTYCGLTGTSKVMLEEHISGEGETMYIPASGEGDEDYVTITAPEIGFESGTSKVYYAVVYPGEYEGFEATYVTGNETPETFVVNIDSQTVLERNYVLSFGAVSNPYDTLPETVTVSLDFLNEGNVNPLGTFPKMAEQSAEGDVYAYEYPYEYKGEAMTLPLEFALYKGAGYAYTYLGGATTGESKYLYVMDGDGATCLKLPAVKGRYLKNVSFTHTGTTYSRNFRLQEGYPAAGHYYTVSPSSDEGTATGVITIPTGTKDSAKINETKENTPYYVQFTSTAKYNIANITVTYAKTLE